jgi:hypothetical protein
MDPSSMLPDHEVGHFTHCVEVRGTWDEARRSGSEGVFEVLQRNRLEGVHDQSVGAPRHLSMGHTKSSGVMSWYEMVSPPSFLALTSSSHRAMVEKQAKLSCQHLIKLLLSCIFSFPLCVRGDALVDSLCLIFTCSALWDITLTIQVLQLQVTLIQVL